MLSLNVTTSGCTLTGPQGETVLLDCDDLLSNKSRISMCRLPEEGFPTLPEFLGDLLRNQQRAEGAYALSFGVIDALLLARLIRSAGPAGVLEYGCGQGELSVHLAKLLGSLHPESSLVCAYDTIEPAWMERISQVQPLPKLSFLAGDFGALGLRPQGFDLVVINGAAGFEDPFGVLEDACSLVKEDGALLCYTQESPLLESAFKLFFETRQEYVLTPFSSVLLAEAADRSWSGPASRDPRPGAEADLARAALEGGGVSREELAALVRALREDVSAAVQAGDAALKIELLACRERLMNQMLETRR